MKDFKDNLNFKHYLMFMFSEHINECDYDISLGINLIVREISISIEAPWYQIYPYIPTVKPMKK